MNINLRKFTKFVDKTFIEGGKEAKEPVLLVWSNFPGLKHEDAMRSIKLFNEEVIPKINTGKQNIKRAS